jgi:hypothetical protein
LAAALWSSGEGFARPGGVVAKGKRGDEREIRGSYSTGFDGHLVCGDGARVNVGVTRAKRKGEGIAGKKTLTGGTQVSEREGRGTRDGLVWEQIGPVGSRVRPSWAMPSFFLF